jgi:hypothetical protein
MILRRPVRIRLRLEFKMVVADEDVDVLGGGGLLCVRKTSPHLQYSPRLCRRWRRR